MKRREGIVTVGSLIALMLGWAFTEARAQNLSELRWDHRLEHYKRAEASAYDAWVITPPSRDNANPQDFEAIIDAISKESNR